MSPDRTGTFRFEVGDQVRVMAHPARPRGTIVARWTGAELGDVYGENIYALSSFVTKQRESSLAADPEGREPGVSAQDEDLDGLRPASSSRLT